MKKRILALGLALLLGGSALAAGGSSGDPLLSLSYLTDTFLPQLMATVQQRAQAGSQSVYDQADSQLTDAAADLQAQLSDLPAASGDYDEQLTQRRVKAGDVIACPTGSTFLLLAGSATLTQGLAVDATNAYDVYVSTVLYPDHRYITPEDTTARYIVTSDTAVVATQGYYTHTPSSGFDCNQLADALFAMGIFQGTNVTIGSGYNLEAAPTRIQGLIMFLRLLGEEQQALACTSSHPFQDVPDWCAPYVAYAYEKGYTSGVDLVAGRFGTNSPLTATQYITFVLRALGYRDSGADPDFSWDTAMEYCQSIGLLTSSEVTKFSSGNFLRAHMVYLSYYALSFPAKGSSSSLLDKLISSGTVDAATAMLTVNGVTSPRIA